MPDAMPTPERGLARSVRLHRWDRLHLTAQDLANRIEAAGGKLSRQAISKIENGDRGVSVDELLALAYALGVSPMDLLVPPTLEDDAPYAVTPTVTAKAGRVRVWIGGGFLHPPETINELSEAIQGMPRNRAEQLAEAAWSGPGGHLEARFGAYRDRGPGDGGDSR